MIDNTLLGRMDALELLLTELLFDSVIRKDRPMTEHQFQAAVRKLIVAHGEALREFGHPKDRIDAFIAVMNRIAGEVSEKLCERAAV